MVLCSVSSYFRAMFTCGLSESQWSVRGGAGSGLTPQDILLPGVSKGGLQQVLGFVYSGQLGLTPHNIQEVLQCAAHLQVRSRQRY